MISLIAAFAISANQPSLAFVARFYKPGPHKSQFQIFVSDLSGNGRKVLKTPEEPNAVQWIGKDQLVWTAKSGIWTSKLSMWHPMLVKDSKGLNFCESRWRVSQPGHPELQKGQDETKGIFQLNPQKGEIEQIVRTPNHTETALSDDTFTKFDDPNDPDHPISLKKYEGFGFWQDGKMVTNEWSAFRAWSLGTQLWIYMGSHDSTSGDINGIMLFEKGKKARTIFENANMFDFWRDRAIYAYCSPRTTSKLGKKEVWPSELHIGDWKKGTDRAILKGLVWVPSVSIRP